MAKTKHGVEKQQTFLLKVYNFWWNKAFIKVQGSMLNFEFSLYLLDQREIQRREGGFICPIFPTSFWNIGMGGFILKAPPLMWQGIEFDCSLHKKSFLKRSQVILNDKECYYERRHKAVVEQIPLCSSLTHTCISSKLSSIPKLARGEVGGVPCGYLYPFWHVR
jgi:hypothetical protein